MKMTLGLGLDLSSPSKGGAAPVGIDLDFASKRYAVNSTYSASFPAAWSFARIGTGTAQNNAGTLVQFASGAPRITDQGLLVEEARTNLLLNSAALSTQTVTVPASPCVLTMFGTGSVALSGASTAGPLVGTGAANRVELAFTPTAGSLTLMVTGSVTFAQLEVGAFSTLPIVTAGSTVTRAVDAPLLTGVVLPVEWTVIVDGGSIPALATAAGRMFDMSDGTATNAINIYRDQADQGVKCNVGNDGAVTALTSGFVGRGAVRAALSYKAGQLRLAAGGVVSAPVTAPFPALATRLSPGNRELSGGWDRPANTYIKRLQIKPYGLGSPELVALTA